MAAAMLVWPEKKMPLDPGGKVKITPGDKMKNTAAR
jgi:hypothetical protein